MKHPMTRFFILLGFLVASPVFSFSQYFTTGADPASVKWIQIKTPNFRIICPEDFGRHSHYIAAAMEYLYGPVTRSLRSNPKPTPIVLHNRTVVANGITPYAPRRIEFYTTPPQDLYAQEWIDQLMIHEFRHSAQYASVDRGFTRVLSYILGQQAIPAMVGLFVPMWFVEGDATVTETALTLTGRGRVPSFEMRLRAQFLEKGIYPYDKAINGSYRDLVPDNYELGYQLVGHSRLRYGEQLWSTTMANVGNHPYYLSPMPLSLIRQIGFARRKLYSEMTQTMNEEWLRKDRANTTDSYAPLSPAPERNYTSYQMPVPLHNGEIVAERSDLNDLKRIVLFDSTGQERRLAVTPAGYLSESLSGSGDRIFWSEQSADPRWEHRSYRILRSLDLRSGKIRTLTRRTRLFAPSVSSDGNRLAAVEVQHDNTALLTILDAGTGKVLQHIAPPDGEFIRHPAWSAGDNRIVLILLGKNGNALALADPISETIRPVMPFTYSELKKPVFCNNFLVFTASFNGIDNLYALDPASGKLFRITRSRFGATDPAYCPSTQELVFADYSSDGYRIVSIPVDTTSWMPVSLPEKPDFPLADALSEQEKFIFQPDSVPDTSYSVKPYRKGLHTFNPHSWEPFYLDLNNYKITPGALLLSQNILGTSSVQAGYSWNINERTGKYLLKWTYTGLYPAFDLSADYGTRRKTIHAGTVAETGILWHEFNLALAAYLPLKWTHNRWYRGVQPKISGSLTSIDRGFYYAPGATIDRNFLTLDYSVSVYNQEKMSHRDLFPRWGQTAAIAFRNSPFNTPVHSQFAAEGRLYFPGLFRHHSISIYAGYQEARETYYAYSDRIDFPKGYTGINSTKILSLSLFYALPLFYPDWCIAPVIYVKRFRTAVFYDHALLFDWNPVKNINTAGIDLIADFHIIGYFVPMEAGLRTMYLSETGRVQFRFLFAIHISR